ncbi:MAG: imidazoleglycerol-phosphate dehydratase HisB [Clostridium sp.]|uniref:imidazoleglycerol-phosphate dehydratase HisB n=1 Tax=Clostridium sp. TaxID=1506 RepID=UPI002907BA5C|nr:imidazoleglycerol-phosphate dehydratase HisB [Clostridium sp.]MDU7337437.1 imidazoleglycerol-phosphate dehydratase HisB [Clostridium sp.]
MRTAEQLRNTKETQICVRLALDGGETNIETEIGFFDHMLQAFATHGGFGLQIQVKGDLYVDGHHTVEDTGIVLGRAFREALGNRSGIARFGSFYVPMDESLAFAAIDVSGRPFLVFQAEFPQQTIGAYDACLTEEFFRAFAMNAELTLHTRVEYGNNSHHMVEAMFKAVAHALRLAVAQTTPGQVLSTKGSL